MKLDIIDPLVDSRWFDFISHHNFLRPYLPIKARQLLQNRYNANIKLRENFIYDDLVNYLKENNRFW